MREAYRLNKDRFPADGALLYLLMNTEDETAIRTEMFELAKKLMDRLQTDTNAEDVNDR